MLSSSSMAVAASLAIHVSVVGLALGRAYDPASRSEPVVEFEMLPAATGPTLEPALLAPPIEPTPVAALSSPLLPRRTRPAAGRAPSTPAAPPSAPAGSDSAPHFAITIPSAQAAAPARFALPVANMLVSTAPSALRQPAGSGVVEDTFAASEVAVQARLVASAALVYPAEARAAEVEADVAVEIVVDSRGRVSEARALATTGYGLDQAALCAVRAYRFSPAQRSGRAVRVRMRWNVQFRLR
jgi:TonB family protein